MMLLFSVNLSACLLILQVTDPKVVELPDDRIDTYLRAIRPEINPQLQVSYNCCIINTVSMFVSK